MANKDSEFLTAEQARNKIEEIKYRKVPECVSVLKEMITDAVSKCEYSIQFSEMSLEDALGAEVDDDFIYKAVKPLVDLGYKFSESHCRGRKHNFTLYHLQW